MHVKTDGKGGSFIYKGGDRMNFLRICRYLYTKKLFGEIVLFIQLICMLEMSFVKRANNSSIALPNTINLYSDKSFDGTAAKEIY